ncbi:hypothetical protein [Microbacterium sp. NPDC077184]|uniref:hypothetical protein n=1 Tax=Microbacterium sp. NPDC077184 TaxID=3154764 RepID=UPI003424CD4B
MAILDDDDPFPSVEDSLRRTLEDMRWISHPAVGAIIYPAGMAAHTDLPQKLSIAIASTVLGVSLAHAERTYKHALSPPGEPKEKHVAFVGCYQTASGHIEEAGARFRSTPDAALTLGMFAASIALHRVNETLSSAYILYKLGQQLEGDTIARYMLEQVAWAYTARTAESHEELDKIKSHSAISAFKKIAPAAGPLYGRLSQSTHAGNSTHRSWFDITPEGRGVVTTRRAPGVAQATTLLTLADMWVLALEATQIGHMLSYEAIDPATGTALEDRAFLTSSQEALDRLQAVVDGGDP